MKKHICLLFTSIIFYLGVIPSLNLIVRLAFNYDKLREYDLNDFGELINDIEKRNNSYLKRVLIIEIVSVILCISPLYYIISLFVLVIFKFFNKGSNHKEINKIISNEDIATINLNEKLSSENNIK